MGRLVTSAFLSLDGVMDSPSRTAPSCNDESAAIRAAEVAAALLKDRHRDELPVRGGGVPPRAGSRNFSSGVVPLQDAPGPGGVHP